MLSFMPNYKARVTYEYPVAAVDPKDAFSTIPIFIKLRFIGCHARGDAEIIDATTGKTVLRAVLNPEDRKEIHEGQV